MSGSSSTKTPPPPAPVPEPITVEKSKTATMLERKRGGYASTFKSNLLNTGINEKKNLLGL